MEATANVPDMPPQAQQAEPTPNEAPALQDAPAGGAIIRYLANELSNTRLAYDNRGIELVANATKVKELTDACALAVGKVSDVVQQLEARKANDTELANRVVALEDENRRLNMELIQARGCYILPKRDVPYQVELSGTKDNGEEFTQVQSVLALYVGVFGERVDLAPAEPGTMPDDYKAKYAAMKAETNALVAQS